MLEAFRTNQLVNRIFTGDHEQLNRDFQTDFNHFIDDVTEICSDPDKWDTNKAELIKLESNLELYNMVYKGPSEAVRYIIQAVLGFLTKIEAHFTTLHAQIRIFRKSSRNSEDDNVEEQSNNASSNEVAEIELIEAIEFTYASAHKLFPKLSKTQVRNKVNIFLGTKITDRQMHNNYSNIKRRMDDDHAQFLRRWYNEFNDHLIEMAATDDERKKCNRR